MKLRLAETAMVFLATAGLIPFGKADNSVRSAPPDTHYYSRPVVPDDFDPLKRRTLS
jgi:hypothetical protein